MPLHTPDGLVAPEWEELAGKIVNGDGLGWPGDPRLSLGIGVVEGRDRSGRVRHTGRRLEVWRHNEDGSDTLVAHWRPEEIHRVCYDLARMRVDSPGYVSVEDRIDEHNAKLEKAASDKYVDAMSQLLDHAVRLHHDRTQPRNTFYMAGDGRRGGRA